MPQFIGAKGGSRPPEYPVYRRVRNRPRLPWGVLAVAVILAVWGLTFAVRWLVGRG